MSRWKGRRLDPIRTEKEADAMTAIADPDDFIRRYGALFEHSPWVVHRAAARLPFGDPHAGMMAVVQDASPDERLALIRAHPELAGKAAVDGSLTEASAAEQASAGLDRLTQAEFDRFHQ